MADGLVQLGAAIPDDFRASVADLPYSAAVNRYRQWHAEQVMQALHEAGIPHDPAALRPILLWENVTDTEGGSDLGNLPRLLSALGLGGEWDDWVHRADAPPPELDAAPGPAVESTPPPAPHPKDDFTPVLELVEPHGLTPVAGDPVALSLDEFTLIRFWVEALMRRAGAEAARRRAAPHDDEVLLRGQCGVYWRSDFTRLEELEQETRARFDTALAGAGFEHVGDLVAKKQRDIVMRGFVSGDRRSYAIVMGKRTMYLGYRFFTRFADGSTLTTALSSTEDSQPERGLNIKIHPGLEPTALYGKHLWGIGRFHTHKATEPVALEPSLLALAREYDHALAQGSG
jgi:hypothetical protein